MKIKSIRECGKGQTYDLEVNHPEHQFYCNGILTSNSHSISYTYTSFREYYLKAYYDPEFNVALLNNTAKGKESKGESVISQYITEIIKKGYNIVPPDVNSSLYEFSLLNDKHDCRDIVWGLGWVKNLPDTTIEKIIEARSKGVFSSIEDLFERVGKSAMNKRAIEALVWSGALDLYGKREDVHHKIYTEIRKEKDYIKEPIDTKKIIEKEIEFCSISMLEIKEFASIKREVVKSVGKDIDSLNDINEEGSYFCVGKVDKVENKKTKTKKDYVRVSLRDETEVAKGLFVWPWKNRKWSELKKGQMIFAQIDTEGGFKNLSSHTVIS